MKQVSLKNIAKELGISVATVSLVLNGKAKNGRISEEMVKKVLNCAKKMNYQPNRIAQSLRTRRTNTIGLVVADISNVFFGSLAFHVQEAAEKYGLSVVITNTNESDERMEEAIRILRGQQVAGLIIVPTENGERTIQGLINDKIPFVLIDRYYPNIESSYVMTDTYSLARKATEKLMKKGSKRIALLTYKNSMPHMLARKQGYQDALVQESLFDPSIIKEVRYTHMDKDIEKAINELLEHSQPVDGIFFSTNSISLIALKKIINRGLQIPKDIKVVCFDKSEVYNFMQGSISYIQQPVKELGEKAVEILLSHIQEKITEAVRINLPGELVNS